jgi:hypothetical protein
MATELKTTKLKTTENLKMYEIGIRPGTRIWGIRRAIRRIEIQDGIRGFEITSEGWKSGTMEHELTGTNGVLGSRRSSSGGRRSGRVCRSGGRGPEQQGLSTDGDSSGAADREDNADGAGISDEEDKEDGAGVARRQNGEDELCGTGDGGLKSSGLGRWRSGGQGSKTETSWTVVGSGVSGFVLRTGSLTGSRSRTRDKRSEVAVDSGEPEVTRGKLTGESTQDSIVDSITDSMEKSSAGSSATGDNTSGHLDSGINDSSGTSIAG